MNKCSKNIALLWYGIGTAVGVSETENLLETLPLISGARWGPESYRMLE